jgi:mannose-6-phosphate isomerase-like protein (cupin superfamily)
MIRPREESTVATVDIYRADAEFYTAEHCHINELHNRASDTDCSIARARVAPGETTRLHCVRDTVERYVTLAGEGEVRIAQQAPVRVNPLDVITIPAGAPQRIANTGAGELVFLCVCTPRFREENYLDLEEAPAHG